MVENENRNQESSMDNVDAEALLDLIVAKEEEIRARIKKAEHEAERLIEEAKLDASVLRREAREAEIGEDMRESELERARIEAEKVTREIEVEAEEIKVKGMKNIDEAVSLIMKYVLPAL